MQNIVVENVNHPEPENPRKVPGRIISIRPADGNGVVQLDSGEKLPFQYSQCPYCVAAAYRQRVVVGVVGRAGNLQVVNMRKPPILESGNEQGHDPFNQKKAQLVSSIPPQAPEHVMGFGLVGAQ